MIFIEFVYEYGIDWKIPSRREDTPHRTGMTLKEAQEWLDEPLGGNVNWTDVFEIVRRPIGVWETYEPQEANSEP